MNCILTIIANDFDKKIGETTLPNHEAYAKKLGVDFVVLGPEIKINGDDYEIYQIFKLLNKYERVIYLDKATLVREDCPNLFDEIPASHLGVFNKLPFSPQSGYLLQQAFEACGKKRINILNEYYDTSVMVVSRQQKFLFKPNDFVGGISAEQFLNMRIQSDLEVRVGGLKYKFNRMSAIDMTTGEERFDSYIINYNEIPDFEMALSYVKKDAKKWTIDKYSGYSYKRHILILATAGLGDQINAEPVVRKAIKLWPNADIRVATDYPRIFSHLADKVEVTTHKQVRQDFDGSFFTRNCNPAQNTEFSSHIDGILSPIIDFASLSVLKRVLGDEEKRPCLEVYSEDINNVLNVVGAERPLEDYVLVHAGKHWETNAFPAEWWTEVIDGIQKKAIPVILIGKQVLEPIKTGYVPLDAPEGVIDTRDLFDLGALFALISKASMLISNDSSPLHMAAAFDNDIVAFPTVKHPDHIIPIRHGARNYKSKALFKKLLVDDLPTHPTSMYGTSIETMPYGLDILDYIPEPKKVVEYVVSRYNEIKSEVKND